MSNGLADAVSTVLAISSIQIALEAVSITIGIIRDGLRTSTV